MKVIATPLLDGDHAKSFEIDDLNPRTFVNLLDQHKALLLASTDEPFSTQDFGTLVASLNLTRYPYVGGAAPRTIIPVDAGADIVFTANESPPDQPIPFHHELAQTPHPPNYIFFYCHQAAVEGGETPIIDSTAVYRFALDNHPDFVHTLVQHGVIYIRTLPADDDPSSPIGRSYKNAYNVSCPAELDAVPTIASTDWQPDGSVRVTTRAVPAIRTVADPNENFVFQRTFSNSIVAAYLGWQDVRNDRHDALRFGNGEKMPQDVLESIAAFMDRERVLYTWKKGDIMALNNQLVMHSRNPFVGPRQVYASIWGPPLDNFHQPIDGVSIGSRDPFTPLNPADPLVFGFWKVPKENCADICYRAIEAGYRRLDCASDYGNEEQVGLGIARALEEGLCQRKDLFVTSKLWNTHHSPQHVPLALAKTLKDLQLTYVDEYLIHFPISTEFVPFEAKYPPEWHNLDGKMVIVPNDMGATWKAMEAMYDEGLCKTIGVCNYSTQLLRQLLSTCRVRPATLQIEMHPHNTQEKLLRVAHDAGLRVSAFSVLGASSYIELGGATEQEQLTHHKTIVDLAKQKNKTPAQILLRWAIQRNTLPLCKTSSPARMIENRSVFDFSLTVAEMERVSALNKNKRYNDPGVFCENAFGTFCPIYE